MSNTNLSKTENPKKTDSYADDQVDFIALAKTLWKGRKIIIRIVAVFTVLGLFVAIFSPVEYTAKTIMVPQIQSKSSNLGGLSSLAAMAGFNLDAMQSGSSELSPMVYPQIVQSIPFQLAIMNTPITWNGIAKPISLLCYYDSVRKFNPLSVIKKYTIGLPGVLLQAIRGREKSSVVQPLGATQVISLTKEEKKIREMLAKNLSLLVNSKDGYITLTTVAPEALAAAQLTAKAQILLQDQVTEFKIDKARQNLAFVESLYKEKKEEYANAQARLASYRDRNLNLGSAMAKTEGEKLESQSQLAFTVFNEVAKQLENAKIKVKEDTPIFSIIEPVSIPTEKTKPKRTMILVIWIFLGGITGIGWIFGTQCLSDIKKRFTSED